MNNPSQSGMQLLSGHGFTGAHHSKVTRASRTLSLVRLFILTVLTAGLAGQFSIRASAQERPAYYRLQLKHGGQYLDADHCTNRISLNPGSDWDGGACQLWRLVSNGDGWSRLQLKHGGQYLDADHCTNKISLNPGSDWDGGACQLWRLVPNGDGWSRLQLKHGGQYLDADHCTNKISLNPGSDWDGGACQLWRLVPVRGQ
jgi:Ricin-type beta-trefoil lectin domain-like